MTESHPSRPADPKPQQVIDAFFESFYVAEKQCCICADTKFVSRSVHGKPRVRADFRREQLLSHTLGKDLCSTPGMALKPSSCRADRHSVHDSPAFFAMWSISTAVKALSLRFGETAGEPATVRGNRRTPDPG